MSLEKRNHNGCAFQLFYFRISETNKPYKHSEI